MKMMAQKKAEEEERKSSVTKKGTEQNCHFRKKWNYLQLVMEPQGKKQKFPKLSVKLTEKILLETEIPEAEVETAAQIHRYMITQKKTRKKIVKKRTISAKIL